MPRHRLLSRLRRWAALLAAAGLCFAAAPAMAGGLSRGQLVYVPVYSHVYYGDREQPLLLTAILSIRNTDPAHPITITQADYFDTEGRLIRKYLTQPLTLKPLGSTRFVIKESDTKGGSGANFLVRWQAETEVNEPILEGVMIGATGQQGISFTSRGQAVTGR